MSGEGSWLSRFDAVIFDVGGTLAFQYSYRLGQKRIDDDAARVLRLLHSLGKRLVVCSNTHPASDRWSALEDAGVHDTVALVLASHALGVRKPDPLMYELAHAAARCPRDRIVFVGNNLLEDVQAPLQAGFHACLVWDQTRGEPPPVPKDVPVIGHVRELFTLT